MYLEFHCRELESITNIIKYLDLHLIFSVTGIRFKFFSLISVFYPFYELYSMYDSWYEGDQFYILHKIFNLHRSKIHKHIKKVINFIESKELDYKKYVRSINAIRDVNQNILDFSMELEHLYVVKKELKNEFHRISKNKEKDVNFEEFEELKDKIYYINSRIYGKEILKNAESIYTQCHLNSNEAFHRIGEFQGEYL